MTSELAISAIEQRSSAPIGPAAGTADERPETRDLRPRLPFSPPRPPVGLRELLGLGQGEYPTGFAAALQPARVRPPVAPTYHPNPASLREAFDAIPGGGPARTRQLTGNIESWASTWDMLTRAQRSIDSTYYIVERDIFGFAFLGHLLRKQRQGVGVRLMVDAIGDVTGRRGFTGEVALALPPRGGGDYLDELAAAGSDVRLYQPLALRALRLPEGFVFGTSAVAAVNHDKLLITDGQVGKTGGRNIANYYFADPADLPRAWHDGDSETRGAEQARDFTTAFDREFRSGSTWRVAPDALGNLVRREIELLGAYHLMDLWMRDPPLSDPEQQALRGDASRRSAMANALVERALDGVRADGVRRVPSRRERELLTHLATELVGYTRTRGSALTYDREARFFDAEVKVVDRTSAAISAHDEIGPALITIVRGAQRRIVIQNQYVVLTRGMIDELARASARGVEIVFATNSPLSSDSTSTQAFFLEDWAYILARVPTARFLVATGSSRIHGKMAVVDDDVSIISTYNTDWLSAYVNSEVGEITWSRERATDLMASFTRDLEDPRNGILEYRIRRHADGSAVLVDRNAGTGRAPDWQPVVEFGPENHLPAATIEEYAQHRRDWNRIRGALGRLAPLRQPPLTYPAPRPGERAAR